MPKRKRKKTGNENSSKRKSELVERIVAMLHEHEPQVTVRRDVRLPAQHDGKRSRQFDVLLEGRFAGYSTMLVIECKNFGRPADVGDVGRFRDLLEDVGFYPSQGVLVSASGVSSGALSRVRELGMKVYELTGLTPDRLPEAIHEATQLMIFMVPAYSGLTIRNEVDRAGPDELMTLFDQDGNVVAYLPDLIWLNWLAGKPPSIFGEYELDLEVPKGWHTQVSARRVPIMSASAKVKVHAAVVALPGTGPNFRANPAWTRPAGEEALWTRSISSSSGPGQPPRVLAPVRPELLSPFHRHRRGGAVCDRGANRVAMRSGWPLCSLCREARGQRAHDALRRRRS